MILSVPFAYDVVGFEPRRRNPSQDRRAGVVEAWVEDVRPEDAPVALVWNRGRDFDGKPQPPLSIRHHAGGLWVGASDSKDTPGLDEGPRPVGDELKAAVLEGRRGGNPFVGFISQMPRAGARPMAFAREIRSNREDVEAEVRARAAEIVVIDGELHLRCPEPVFVRGSHGYRKASEGLQAHWYEPYLYSGRMSGNVYRVDEWDRLLVDARREHDGHPGNFDLPEAQSEFEVLLPDAFMLPTEGVALSGAAFNLMSGLGDELKRCAEGARRAPLAGRAETGRDPLAWDHPCPFEMPDPAILDAWMRLGGILRAGLDDNSGSALREIAGLRVPAHGSTWRFDSLVDRVEELVDALDRWDARPSRLVREDVAAFAGIGALP